MIRLLLLGTETARDIISHRERIGSKNAEKNSKNVLPFPQIPSDRWHFGYLLRSILDPLIFLNFLEFLEFPPISKKFYRFPPKSSNLRILDFSWSAATESNFPLIRMLRSRLMHPFLLLWRARVQEPRPVSFHWPRCDRQRTGNGMLRDREGG